MPTSWPPQFEPLLYWIHHLNRPDCHSLRGIKPAFCLNWSQIVAINAGTFCGLSLNSRLLSVFPSFESFCDPFYVQPPLPRHHSWGGSYMFPHLGKCALFLRPFPIWGRVSCLHCYSADLSTLHCGATLATKQTIPSLIWQQTTLASQWHSQSLCSHYH